MTTGAALRGLLVVAIVVVPSVAVPGPLYGFDVPKLIAIAVLCTSIGVLAVPRVPAVWRGSGPQCRALLVLAGAFALWLLVATLVSDTWRLSMLGTDGRFVGTVATVFPITLMLAVPAAIDGWRRFDRLLLLIAAVLGAISVYAVIQWAGLDPMPWAVPRGGRPVATFGNSNFVGAALCITTPLAFYLWFRRPSLRFAAMPLLVMGAAAILASQARLGMVAAAAGGMAFALVQLRSRRTQAQGWAVALLAPLAPVIGTLAVIVGILIEDRTGLARLGYWRAAIPMWLDNPIFGVGPGRFLAFHPAYRPPGSVIEGRIEVQVDSSHNWLLDLASTTGTPGALLWLVLLVAAGLVLRQVWLLDGTRYRPAVAGLTGMLAAHGVQSSISVPTVVPLWLGWLVVALTLTLGVLTLQEPQRGGDDPQSGDARRVGTGKPGRALARSAASRAVRARQQRFTLAIPLLAVVLVVVVAVPAVAVWNTARDLGTAGALIATQRHELAREPLEAAAQRTPWWPEPWRELMRVAAAEGDAELLGTARHAAYAADPRSRSTMFVALESTLAIEGLALGEPWIERLQVLDPNGLESNLATAAWALRVEDLALADEALDAAAVVVGPDVAGWERYTELTQVRAELGGN